jgi:hypothetical protein
LQHPPRRDALGMRTKGDPGSGAASCGQFPAKW